MEKKPSKRMDAKNALKHPWFGVREGKMTSAAISFDDFIGLDQDR
jgi:hypothetical protein